MSDLLEQTILCPYCNEAITLLIDPSVDHQDYIEDCQVCCRPIEISASFDMDGDLILQVKNENE